MKLKFSECDHKGPFEGSVLFYLGLSFYLIQKKGNFLYFFSLSISTFDKIKTKTYINILRHTSLKLHLMNTCAKFDEIEL